MTEESDDTTYRRIVVEAFKPLWEEIQFIRLEIEALKKNLHKTSDAGEEQLPGHTENWNPDWKGDPEDPQRWKGW